MNFAYYNEIDPYAAEWIRNLIRKGHVMPGVVDERDIRNVKADEIRGFVRHHFFAGIAVWDYALRLAEWPEDRPVVTGSCPCPPFSQAGKGQRCPECGSASNLCHPRKTGHFICLDCGCDRHADDRHLWPEFSRIIRELGVSTVFGEQVASKDGRLWLGSVQADLATMGYTVGGADLCAAGVGAPHIRQRLWFVGDTNEPRTRRHGGAALSQETRGGSPRRSNGLRGSDEPFASGATRILANTNGRDASEKREQRSGQHGQQPENRFAGIVGDANRARSAVGPLEDEQRGTVRLEGAAIGATGALRGAWSGAQWLWCSDHRWRPVEPGTFPLAHGAPARVGRLRAYGNAICPQAAATFIRAFADVRYG